MGYVYLINEWGTNNYKIGVTKMVDINKRLTKLQTGNSSELRLVNEYKTQNPFKLERMLHRFYFKENITNEWFELTNEQVSWFTPNCKKYDEIISLMLSENFFYNS